MFQRVFRKYITNVSVNYFYIDFLISLMKASILIYKQTRTIYMILVFGIRQV